MSAVVELVLAAAAYRLLRDNVGRAGVTFGAAARVYTLYSTRRRIRPGPWGMS